MASLERVERAVVEIVDNDLLDAAMERGDSGKEQVVGHGAGRLMALEGQRNRIGFKRPDPDGDIAAAILLAQNNNALLHQQTEAYAINLYANHSGGPF